MYAELWSRENRKTRIIAKIQGDGTVEEIEPLTPDIREDIEAQKARVPGDAAFLKSLLVMYQGAYIFAKVVNR